MKVILPDAPSSSFPTARPASTRPARSARSSPSRPSSCARTARCRIFACRSTTAREIQILTTRDRDDPDALFVLRHSAAHLLAEAARRLYPGTKVAIGPPIENGFYYDFEFPEPVGEEALERLEDEIQREIAEGRTFERWEVDRDEARRIFEAEGEPYKVELVDTAEGDISLLPAGRLHRPLPRPAPPGLRRRSRPSSCSRSPAPTGAATSATRSSPASTARRSSTRRTSTRTSSGSRRRSAATTAGSAASSTSSTSTSTRPARRSGIRGAWSIWNALEDLRRRENAKRGYLEVKTPLLYDTELWEISGHWEKYRDNMFLDPAGGEDLRAEADELPGPHAALREPAAQLPRAARSASPRPPRCTATSRAARCTACCACATSPRTTPTSSARAEQIEDEIFGCLDFAAFLYDLFGMEARFELSTRPENKLGTDEEWDFTEAALARGARAAGHRLRR